MLSSYQIRDHGIITWKKFHKGSLSNPGTRGK